MIYPMNNGIFIVNKIKGFTLLEIMITVSIIGLLVAIAVPNYIRAKRQTRKTLCLNNMRLLDSAILQYLIHNQMLDNQYNQVTLSNIVGVTGYIENEPKCPLADSASYYIWSTGVTCPSLSPEYHGYYKNGKYTD